MFDNNWNILILIFVLVLIFAYFSNCYEGFAANDEAIAAVASIYNKDEVKVTNITATNNLSIDKGNLYVGDGTAEWSNSIKIRGGQKEGGYLEFQDKDKNRQSFIMGSPGGAFASGNFAVNGNLSAKGNLNVTATTTSDHLNTNYDVNVGRNLSVKGDIIGPIKVNIKNKSYDFREFFSPGFIQTQWSAINLVKGFMLGWNDGNGRKLWAEIIKQNPNTPIVFAGDLRGGGFHFMKVHAGFKVRLWHYNPGQWFAFENQSQYGLTNGDKTLSIEGPKTFIGTQCHMNDCPRYKFMPCCNEGNSQPRLSQIHLIWCGFIEEPYPTFPGDTNLSSLDWNAMPNQG